MNGETEEKLGRFFGAFTAAAKPVLLLDYDGTLSPFRADRFKAKPYAGVREVLQRIQTLGQTRMAVVTGRTAEEIAPLLGLDPPLEVWGLHGAERLFPDGRRELEQATSAVLETLQDLREQLRRDSLGGRFEDKANGAVIHWRGKSLREAKRIERRARELFAPLAQIEGLELVESVACLELRAGRDKGGAVEAILSETAGAGPVAFLGDDVSDEPAFRAVNRISISHLSVLMRREWRQTAADVWLTPPGELREFLQRWVSASRFELETWHSELSA